MCLTDFLTATLCRFLEKQAFLERTDIRQFELEKEMRDKARKLRDQMK